MVIRVYGKSTMKLGQSNSYASIIEDMMAFVDSEIHFPLTSDIL